MSSDADEKIIHTNFDPTAGVSGQRMFVTQEAPVGDPAPLGLTALSLPLMALSLINMGWLQEADMQVVITTILIYGGIGQFAVAMWEVRRGNSFGAAAFGTFGLFNVSVWYFLTQASPTLGDATGTVSMHAAGLFGALWAVPAAILFIAALRTTAVVATIFGLATLLFVFFSWSLSTGDVVPTRIAGVVGILLACTAWYGCLQALTAESWGRPILPNPSLAKRSR